MPTDQDVRTLRPLDALHLGPSRPCPASRIVLLAADGRTNTEIAMAVGCYIRP